MGQEVLLQTHQGHIRQAFAPHTSYQVQRIAYNEILQTSSESEQ